MANQVMVDIEAIKRERNLALAFASAADVKEHSHFCAGQAYAYDMVLWLCGHRQARPDRDMYKAMACP